MQLYSWIMVLVCLLEQVFSYRYPKQNWMAKGKGVKTDGNVGYNKTIWHNGLVFIPAKYLSCACGISNSRKVRWKIIGGQETEVMAYPWVSHLTHTDGHLLCGGTLITDRHVLTAAHCVKELTVDNFLVTVGDHDRTISSEAASITVRVSRITVHPKFNSTSFDSDLAILKLCRPVFTDLIRPACIFPPLSDLDGQAVVAVGWGFTGLTVYDTPRNLSDALLQVDLNVVSRAICLLMPLEPYEKLILTENMICAGDPRGGKDACNGDSGGPLMWNYLGRWYVIGIISKGFGCAKPGKFGIYVKMNNFLDWITSVTVSGLQCIR